MKLVFTKTFTGAAPRRPGDLRAKPVVVEVFDSEGRRWIRGLRLASLLGISTSALRQAVRTNPDLQDERHNQLVNLEGECSGPVRMLTIDGARRLARHSGPRRRTAVMKFLDEIERHGSRPPDRSGPRAPGGSSVVIHLIKKKSSSDSKLLEPAPATPTPKNR